MEMQNHAATSENNRLITPMFKHSISIGSSIPTPRYMLQGIKTYVHTKISPQMFTAELSTIAQTKNNPNFHQLVRE
jgi:hypothetical protein